MTTKVERGPTIEDVRRLLRASEFRYIDLAQAEFVIGPIHFGGHSWVACIGHAADGSYEWVAQIEGRRPEQYAMRHSNAGWGNAVSCLREALNVLEHAL